MAFLPLVLPFLACDQTLEPEANVPPNVILIVLDTVSAGHLGVYGYHRPTSPNLREFASGADLYQHAYSTASWTFPSHASLFTGRFPFEHGGHRFNAELEDRTHYENVYSLPLENLTLAEVFLEQGYETACIAANSVYVSENVNLNQGFRHFDSRLREAREINSAVFDFLDEHGDDPFFLFINYLDCHAPYNFGDGNPPFLEEEVSRERVRQLLENEVMGGEPAGRDDLAQIMIDQYDAAIYNLDARLGEVFDELKARDLFRDSLIIVTSDHGEAFGQHDLVQHGYDLYEHQVRVPLIVRAPRQQGGRIIEAPVSNIVVPNLIVSGMDAPAFEAYAGHFNRSPENHPIITEQYYAHARAQLGRPWGDRFLRERKALMNYPFKYIRSSDGQHELYDLEEDPRELFNRIVELPEIAEEMRSELRQWIEKEGPAPAIAGSREHVEFDPALVEDAKALGYL